MDAVSLDGTVTFVLVLSLLNILFSIGRWARGTEFTSDEVKKLDIKCTDSKARLERALLEKIQDLDERASEHIEERVDYMKEKWDDWHLARADSERRLHDRLTVATQDVIVLKQNILELRSRLERVEARCERFEPPRHR